MPGLALPERTFGWTVARRGAALWAGVRVLLMAGTGAVLAPEGVPTFAELVWLGPRAALLAALLPAVLTVLETRRRNEHLLLANLGTGPGGVFALALAPALLAEVLLRLAFGR